MLIDLVMDLVAAVEPKEKERAYRRLERVGVDRVSADVMAAEFWKFWKANVSDSDKEESNETA